MLFECLLGVRPSKGVRELQMVFEVQGGSDWEHEGRAEQVGSKVGSSFRAS